MLKGFLRAALNEIVPSSAMNGSYGREFRSSRMSEYALDALSRTHKALYNVTWS